MVPEGAKAPSFLFSHIYICRHCEERSDEATQGPTRRPSTREPLGCFAFGSQRRKMSCRRRALVFGRLAGPDRTFSPRPRALSRSEEHTSELQSLMRISYAVFCLKKQNTRTNTREKSATH